MSAELPDRELTAIVAWLTSNAAQVDFNAYGKHRVRIYVPAYDAGFDGPTVFDAFLHARAALSRRTAPAS